MNFSFQTGANVLLSTCVQHALYRFNDALLSPYHLHVVVHAADGLLGKRNDGTSYPCAIIEACGQVGSTQVLSNT